MSVYVKEDYRCRDRREWRASSWSFRQQPKALLFSFVGMKTKEVELKDQTTINVGAEEEISDLDESDRGGLRERKRELIGAVSSVKAKDLEEVPSASLENLLQDTWQVWKCRIFPVLPVKWNPYQYSRL